MAEVEEAPKDNYLELVADIISAYVSNNPVPVADLPALMGRIHTALTSLATGPSIAGEPETEKATPAQVRKLITPDALINSSTASPTRLSEAASDRPRPRSL